MTQRKTLGQIAYEAGITWPAWDTWDQVHKDHYERMAQAVARAVRRRGKGGGKK